MYIILSILLMIFKKGLGLFYEAHVRGFPYLQAVEGISEKLNLKKSEVSEIRQWVRVQRHFIVGILQNIRHYSSRSCAKWRIIEIRFKVGKLYLSWLGIWC